MSLQNEHNQKMDTQRTGTGSCAGWVVAGFIWIWIGFVLLVRFSSEILASGVRPAAAESGLLWLPLGAGLAILIPCSFDVFLSRKAAGINRSAFSLVMRTWAWAAVFIIISLPARLGGTTSLQTTYLLQIITGLAFLGLLYMNRRRGSSVGSTERGPAPGQRGSQPWLDWRSAAALIIAGLMGYSWFAWGALGSALDSLLALTTAAVFGLAAAFLIETIFIQPYRKLDLPPMAEFFGGGFVIATTLVIMCSALGFAFGLLQVITMITLAPLGWVWMGLRQKSRYSRSGQGAEVVVPTILVGLAASWPMLFLDANELALVISGSQGEILGWGLKAALTAGLIAGLAIIPIFVSLMLDVKRSTPTQSVEGKRRTSHWPIYLAAGGVWLVGIVIFGSAGQPGFHGEKMLVIFDLQADLSGAAQIQDYAQRKQWVYSQLVNQAELSQATLRQTLERWNIPYQPYYLVNAVEVPNNPLLRVWLERQPAISRVIPSPRLRPLAQEIPISTDTAPAPQEPAWNLTMIGADRVWNEFNATGQGIVIGQSDSGVQWDHPELIGSYRGRADHNYNWLDPWNHSPAPIDHGGHGTHTLGTILGQHTGVAPGATWIACANLDRNLGNPAYYLDCMQFMLAPFPLAGDPLQDGKPELGAMVLNNSWGCPTMEGCDQESLRPAVQALRTAGIFVAASAGNDGPTCNSITDPLAIYPEVFTVGAVDSSGQLAFFSSLGPGPEANKPDLVAPGVGVLSTFPGDSYAELDGTSMAGPHLAGAVALLWSANPKLIGDIETTEKILRESAQAFTGGLPNCPGVDDTPSTAVGMGILDAYSAVKTQK